MLGHACSWPLVGTAVPPGGYFGSLNCGLRVQPRSLPILSEPSKFAFRPAKSGLLRVATVGLGGGINFLWLSGLDQESGIFRRSSPLRPHVRPAAVPVPGQRAPFVVCLQWLSPWQEAQVRSIRGLARLPPARQGVRLITAESASHLLRYGIYPIACCSTECHEQFIISGPILFGTP